MTDRTKLCWICAGIATTGEHLHKKTDVIAVFGNGFAKRVVRTDFAGIKKHIQGPSSKELMFRNSLCAKCNNETTQPYDRAYEKFADYVRMNLRSLTHKLEINTSLIFGKCDAKKQQQYLFRYFVKAFGCQLHDAGLPVPQILKDILKGGNYGKTYRISVCLNSEWLEGLSITPPYGDTNERGECVDFFSTQDNGCFTLVHAYNRSIPSEYGVEWFGKSKKITVGKWSDLS